jgi:tetratricopeptide (TPR) repeat protein
MTTGPGEDATERSDSSGERWFLDDEREFLLRSIDDAGREHDVGDLSDADYAVLVARDRARLAGVDAELAALGPEVATEAAAAADDEPAAPEVTPRRRYGPWRRVGIIVFCLFILGGAVILVDHAVSPAAPGQAPSGTVTLSKAQKIEDQLAAAAVLTNDGEGEQALELYNKVLTEDPDDPYALAAGGWLEWNAGVTGKSTAAVRAGRQSEEKAVRVAPQFYGGHLYLGLIVLDEDDNAADAITQFTAFLKDDPSKAVLKTYASQIAPAWTQAHEPLPASLAAVISSTTTTTTTSTVTSTTTTTTSAP